MTPQELKNSILLLAMQGKLVEEHQEEGTGQELYKQIQDEKRKLSKDGKIMDEKLHSDIMDDDALFDIPENWKWVRIGDIFQHNTGKALNASDREGILLDYITTSNLYWNRFELTKRKQMLFTKSEEEKCTVIKGDLLVCEGGDIGRASIWTYDFPMRIQNHIHRLRPYSHICVEYFYNVFFFYKNAGLINGKGIGIQGLSSSVLHNLIVPLPPLDEQKRIAAKIEEILPYIDRYEQSWRKLEDFNKQFPSNMQKSILQYAFQGKLVNQNVTEGVGEDLYQMLLEEKNRLIKAGTIKKEKPLPQITDDEKPFDIPESWKWARFSEVVDVRDGTHDTPRYVTSGVPLVTSKNLQNGAIDFATAKLISYKDADAINRRSAVQEGDILFAMIGTIGNPVLVKKDREFCIKNMALFKAVNQRILSMEYVLYYLQYVQYSMKAAANGGVQAFVSLTFIRGYLLPLPPVEEQKRIVARLDKILPYINKLKV